MKANTANTTGKENKAQALSPDAKQYDYEPDEILPSWVLERIAKSQTDIAEGRTISFEEFKKRLSYHINFLIFEIARFRKIPKLNIPNSK